MCSIQWAFKVGSWSPTESEWLYAARCIQQDEKDRIGRFAYTKDSKCSMAGRLLIRKVITDCLAMPWCDIQLDRTASGKPYLANAAQDIWPDFTFNISHDGDLVVIAAEDKGICGIDVMDITRPGNRAIPDYFKLMAKTGTDHEWSIVYGAGKEWDQLEMFYRMWCLKECYVKAVGTSLGKELRRLECHPKTLTLTEDALITDTQLYLDDKPLSSWCFEEMKLDKNHYVAVGCHGTTKNDVAPSFKILTFADLISSATPMLPEDVEYWNNFALKKISKRKKRDRNSQHTQMNLEETDEIMDGEERDESEYEDTDNEDIDESESSGANTENEGCTIL